MPYYYYYYSGVHDGSSNHYQSPLPRLQPGDVQTCQSDEISITLHNYILRTLRTSMDRYISPENLVPSAPTIAYTTQPSQFGRSLFRSASTITDR